MLRLGDSAGIASALLAHPVIASILAVAAASYILHAAAMFGFGSNKFPLEGKHVYISGGSQGLGLSLACLFARRGANVTIVARTQSKLDEAIKQMETHRKNPSQRFHSISADLISSHGTSKSFETFAELNGVAAPDYVICCTGGAGGLMGFFTDITPEQIQQGWEANYQTAVYTAHSASKRMVEQGIKGRIVFVSSAIGLFSFAGYSAYSPAKYAIRGLADALRNEFLMYGIGVHCYFPATIFTPGYAAEMLTKPKLTREIEGPEEGNPPEVLAARLLRGLEAGQFLITTDPIGHIFRMMNKGISPSLNGVTDLFWWLSGVVGVPVWRMISDRQVKKYREDPSAAR